jgi:GxxExxY protein
LISDSNNEDRNDQETYTIIGAAMEVHRELGPGFLESVYQDAMELEFKERHIPYVREAAIQIKYKNQKINSSYRADFICYENVIVELKTVEKIDNIHYAQVLNYLKATGHTKSVLLNFKPSSLDYRRIIRD